ncbi:hypothetical protein CY34DRAFT_107197 [Suillus luteus UH-Slu-Lm8-n1]|uniref:Unplaced genomic scaffold CY34scaffold_129, whole genome shotgun sequence n=1 Tax=Suillus luteus UH-Slu-Lm8-n1 TaxID=930992 RepID=A0A0D0AUX4_9AGAM|nr:hypothetical protein CY34DRAFT_107197 [Suillus luteus UH-Slu-Lm8-n1]
MSTSSEAHTGRTLKRPHRDHDESMSVGRASGVHYIGAKVKREQSPTPPPPPRKLIMSGTKRFAPFPSSCLPSNPAYKQHRRTWAKKCQSEIETLELQTEKLLIRDDGVIVDWKSSVPVWSDTLRPPELDLAATITLAHQANAQQRNSSLHHTPEAPFQLAVSLPVTGVDDDILVVSPPTQKLPVPPRPRKNVASPSVSSSPAGGPKSQVPPKPDPPSADVPAPSRPLNDFTTIVIAPDEEEKISKMTMEYLERYFQTFDSDRASLASAYSSNACFSYREVKCFSPGSPHLQPSLPPRIFIDIQASDSIKRTRLDITATLLSLPSFQLLPLTGAADIEYDIMWLGSPVGMFAICGGLCHGHASKQPVTHSFLLRQKEAYEEDARADGVWPLVAVAHQMMVFDGA